MFPFTIRTAHQALIEELGIAEMRVSGDEAKAVNFQKITSYSEKESQAQRIYSYRGGSVVEVLLGFPNLADCDAKGTMTHPVLSLYQIRPAEHLFFTR